MTNREEIAAIRNTGPSLKLKGRQPLGLRIPERILTYYLRPVMRSLLTLHPVEKPVLPPPASGGKYSLYIHIPFCEMLCPYCSFNRFSYRETLARQYFTDLRVEMGMVADLGYRFDTLYIGGGTPTILIDELVALIDRARKLFGIREVSCETNPNHLVPEITGQLEGRVDRLSVGVQSFDPVILKAIGRLDKFGPPGLTLERINKVAPRFPTFNVDMIFNFPGQSEESIQRDIEMIASSAANQTTFYPLMVSRSVERSIGSMGRYDTRNELPLYRMIQDRLSRHFKPESVWTFTRHEQHLIDEYIASGEEYLGIGSGSFSYLDGSLYVNTFSLSGYHQACSAGQFPLAGRKAYSHADRMRYRFLMQFFNRRLDRAKFQEDFGRRVESGLWKEMAFMHLFGAIGSGDDSSLELDFDRDYLIVVMMREFFNHVNQLRDQARRALSQEERRLCADLDAPILPVV
jgi:coproporphyrinogen III oxidase-like Fe-S oxidoreductase